MLLDDTAVAHKWMFYTTYMKQLTGAGTYKIVSFNIYNCESQVFMIAVGLDAFLDINPLISKIFLYFFSASTNLVLAWVL